MADRQPVVGNRLMLVGAVMYLLEWIAIIPAGSTGPSDLAKTALPDITKLYTGNAGGAGFIAGWCSLVLVGRVLIILGARQALVGTRHATLVDWAAIVMGVSVAIELVSVVVVASLSHVVHAGAPDDTVVLALDAIAAFSYYAIMPLLGLSVGVTSWVMLDSRRFPTWIGWLGVAAGLVAAAAGVLLGGSGGLDGGLHSAGMALSAGVGLFWIWMLAAGLYLWRIPRAEVAVGR
jgi:hypothetical protein